MTAGIAVRMGIQHFRYDSMLLAPEPMTTRKIAMMVGIVRNERV